MKKIYCHDCGKEIKNIEIDEESQKITGAKFYDTGKEMFVKCLDCYAKDSVLRDYQNAEVYSRVVGFLRPVQQWNPGKAAEYEQRKEFKQSK